MIVPPLCLSCENAHTTLFTEDVRTCIAFPQGIPARVWESKADHRLPLEGDHGHRFARSRTMTEAQERRTWGKPGDLNLIA